MNHLLLSYACQSYLSHCITVVVFMSQGDWCVWVCLPDELISYSAGGGLRVSHSSSLSSSSGQGSSREQLSCGDRWHGQERVVEEWTAADDRTPPGNDGNCCRIGGEDTADMPGRTSGRTVREAQAVKTVKGWGCIPPFLQLNTPLLYCLKNTLHHLLTVE